MLDPVIGAGMIFSLLVILLIGGFITLFPITRRLGAFLQQKLEQESSGPALSEGELRDVREAVLDLREEVRALRERQDFMEKLLEPGEGRTGSGSGGGG